MSASVITVPNALTLLRFLGIPLFIYLTLSLEADGWAILVLAIGGATDYFDGKIARAWNQTSRFGELADPAIDRLYILATLIVFLIREIVPVWMIAVIIGRDVLLALITIIMNRRGIPPFTVTYLGKAATFNLLYAFPFLLLAQSDGTWGSIAFVAGWSFAIWGIALYISTGISYAREGISQIRGNHVINS
ncbi:MAG: CDP-alcohol phosphatidyltransferase family protein [Actinomycetales bacterium]|nr:CDP-alcohol phosphatidyltransferase family protein [Actinomycetales bacterium]